jgi:outer membrane protein assembly factor BamB
VHSWKLAGDPRGVAIGSDGTIYVGLAQPQAVVALDPKSGTERQRVVLDSAEIASTKELVTLRTNREKTRLYVANGSDESATILTLPDLHVVREITMEGEPIRDMLPDPKGRYVYLLGRHVHVFDANGETELHTLNVDDPTAIAASASFVAVAHGTEIVSFDTVTFAEKGRTPATAGPVGSLVIGSSGLPLALASEGSQYGVNAYAAARDEKAGTLVTTDAAGYVTIYRMPRPSTPK